MFISTPENCQVERNMLTNLEIRSRYSCQTTFIQIIPSKSSTVAVKQIAVLMWKAPKTIPVSIKLKQYAAIRKPKGRKNNRREIYQIALKCEEGKKDLKM